MRILLLTLLVSLLAVLTGPLLPAQEAPPAPEKADPPQPAEAKPVDQPEAEKPAEPGSEPKAEPKVEPKKPAPRPRPKQQKKPQVVPLKPRKGPVDLDANDTGYEQVELLTKAMETIRANYVDKDKVGYDRLMEGALDGMLKSLDPHCQYLRNEVLINLEKQTQSTYDGVGITIAQDKGELVIVNVRENGPAAEAGALPGDRIAKIGEVFTSRVGVVEAVQLLKGRPGEKLEITLRRPKTGEVLAVEITRRVIKQETVRDATLLARSMAGGHRIGYVRLTEFVAPSGPELAEALDEFEKGEGVDAVILDLRNNPGGLLRTAVDILGEFIEPGKVVVTTRGRSPAMTPPPHRTPKRGGGHRTYPLAVLINHSSASASELVSGALQDLHRAVIVGETSFGKGSVQSLIPIAPGKALRLTTAKYYTPSKKTIHENGVVPNIPAVLSPQDEARIFNWWRKQNRSDDVAAELAALDDNQLQRAVDALKGVLVYQTMQSGEDPAAQVEVEIEQAPEASAEAEEEDQ